MRLKEIIKSEDSLKGLRKGLALQKNVEKLRTRALEANAAPEPEKKVKKGPVKKEAPVKAKNEKTKSKQGRVTTAERVEYISPFVKKAKYTKKELLEMMMEKYPMVTKAANQTILTDGKNPKYNKFPKLIVQDDDGIMSFKK